MNNNDQNIVNLLDNLLRHTPIPTAIAEKTPGMDGFRLTPHEQDVMKAFHELCDGDFDAFLAYEVQQTKGDIQKVSTQTLQAYHATALKYKKNLQWALMLHDLAKGRYHHNQMEHPPLGANILQDLEKNLMGEGTKAGLDMPTTQEMKEIIWLVRYHNILGNIYTGEMKPTFPLQLMTKAEGAKPSDLLKQLEVMTLCDLRGTAKGIYLTEGKAQFWLSLSHREEMKTKEKHLLDWRIQRWTGYPSGAGDKEKEREFYHHLEGFPTAEKENIKTTFGKRINYIIYGFYLFTALQPKELATLLHKTTQAAQHHKGNNLTLKLNAIFKPPPEKATQETIEKTQKQLEIFTEPLRMNKLPAELFSLEEWKW